jgi:hypothetical protein
LRLIRRSLALLSLAIPAGAQSWKTLDVSRQLHDTAEHLIRVRYPVGRISVRATSDPVVYSMHLRYDEDRMYPLHRYDPESRRATLGFEGDDKHWSKTRRTLEESEMRLEVSNAVPIDLDLQLGAAEARLNVGGLALSRLRVETGAADARLDFSEPNKIEMRRLDVHLGAAGFVIRNLGNARVSDIRIEGGVGKVDLDFGGKLENDVRVDANVALGKLLLRLPRDVGVRVELQRFIAGFEHPGLHKRGDAWYSDNWDDAKVRVRIRAETVLGAVEVQRSY